MTSNKNYSRTMCISMCDGRRRIAFHNWLPGRKAQDVMKRGFHLTPTAASWNRLNRVMKTYRAYSYNLEFRGSDTWITLLFDH